LSASFNDPADKTLISAAFAVAAAPIELKTSAIIADDILVTAAPSKLNLAISIPQYYLPSMP
jgi:hypothetical protein